MNTYFCRVGENLKAKIPNKQNPFTTGIYSINNNSKSFTCVCNIILVVYAFIYSPDDAVWMYSEILLILSMDVER